jgi:riboflavin biosynthesis pyrimidine reductase
MTRLEVLHEALDLPRFDLPLDLSEAYGGDLGFDRPRLIANFVSTIDGVVAIPELAQSNKLISDGSESERLVMGLLRAAADAVLIGSGTLCASPRGLWTPEKAYPPAADAFADLRRRLDLPSVPARVVVTGTGSIPPTHPLFADGAIVLTTESGASRLDGRLPPSTTVVSLGDSQVDLRAAIHALRARGHELIVSEAGPRTFASLVEAGLVDELFLTVSPLVAGRGPSNGRLGLVEGFEALPGERRGARLLSIRRDGAHLFLRYELGTSPYGDAGSAYSA